MGKKGPQFPIFPSLLRIPTTSTTLILVETGLGVDGVSNPENDHRRAGNTTAVCKSLWEPYLKH